MKELTKERKSETQENLDTQANMVTVFEESTQRQSNTNLSDTTK